ncbi:hypothetical protein MLD38_036748 [Melastoma candidum]|uniref:Uncharacterized protein n=1 Tax=Melastoma candidum TaxID=119954 RepID=A0ACB9LKW8_9MYRT|nr:hypothetical protein MLD38_036748 [Melastoma candidum]
MSSKVHTKSSMHTLFIRSDANKPALDADIIHRGKVIGGEIERVIRGSRVYAVVLSRNYASSEWCLRELDMMVEMGTLSSEWCLRELDMMVDLCGGSNVGGKIILPIFYGVDLQDVKLRTEQYREALDTHIDRRGQDVVKKWEEALKTVGGMSG